MSDNATHIEVTADVNDGDYETVNREITNKELAVFKPIIKAIKDNTNEFNFAGEPDELKTLYPQFDESVLMSFTYYVPDYAHTISTVEVYNKTNNMKLM